MNGLLRSTAIAAVSGFLTRPCCVVPAVFAAAGVGSAGLATALASHRFEFLAISGAMLVGSGYLNFGRDGTLFNKAVTVAASVVAFIMSSGFWKGW